MARTGKQNKGEKHKTCTTRYEEGRNKTSKEGTPDGKKNIIPKASGKIEKNGRAFRNRGVFTARVDRTLVNNTVQPGKHPSETSTKEDGSREVHRIYLHLRTTKEGEREKNVEVRGQSFLRDTSCRKKEKKGEKQ